MINIIALLMISARLAIPHLLKVKVFLNKGYDVMMSVREVTTKILSRESNCIVDVVM